MKEALRADLGSGGKRDPFSEYFLSQLHWRQSTASWGLESRVKYGQYQEAPVDSLCEDAQGAGRASGRQQQNRAPLPLPGF